MNQDVKMRFDSQEESNPGPHAGGIRKDEVHFLIPRQVKETLHSPEAAFSCFRSSGPGLEHLGAKLPVSRMDEFHGVSSLGSAGNRVITSSPDSPAFTQATHRHRRTGRPATRRAWHTGQRCS